MSTRGLRLGTNARILIADSRAMPEIEDGLVDLVVTSPPYWHIKDYGGEGQIGYGQTLHQYLKDLYRVWLECHRTLRRGGRLCINIGDQFARSIIYGRYKVIPLHAEIIAQCERIGFDFMGSIIWQKKTTMNTTGGASVMGSFPYPPNGIVEIDYEFIHIFKKPGPNKAVSRDVKVAAALSTAEWKEYFSGHWYFGGTRQTNHEAMFPEELPRRLIRMFTFPGDTVLDPFLGSGTTVKVALDLGRSAVGYELCDRFAEVIRDKLGLDGALPAVAGGIEIAHRKADTRAQLPEVDYTPSIQDAQPKVDPGKLNFKGQRLYKVTEVLSADNLKLNTGLVVSLAGITVEDKDSAIHYLCKYVLGKEVILKFDDTKPAEGGAIPACVYLRNRIFINGYMVKAGLASTDPSGASNSKAPSSALARGGGHIGRASARADMEDIEGQSERMVPGRTGSSGMNPKGTDPPTSAASR